MSEKYYRLLSKVQYWLGDDNPYSIGGRSTDIGQIGYSLSARVRELYPINQVPEELVIRLAALQLLLDDGEKSIQKLIDFITETRLEAEGGDINA